MNYYGSSMPDSDLTTYGLGFDSGTITGSNGTITITDGVIGGVTVNMTAQVPEDQTTATSFTVGISSATFASDASDATINSGTLTLTTATPYFLDIGAINNNTASAPDINGGSVVLDASLTQKQDAMGAALPATVTFAGAIEVSLVNPLQDAYGDYIWITPKTLSLSGGVSTQDGNSLEFNLTADVTNANTFTPVGQSLPAGTIKQNFVTWSYSGDTFTVMSPVGTITITWNSGDGSATVVDSWNDGYVSTPYPFGQFSSLAEAIGPAMTYSSIYWYLYDSVYYSIWIDGEGGYQIDPMAIDNADFSTNGSVSAELVDPDFVVEDASHWLDANVGLGFHLQLAGQPEAYFTISADRTAYESGTGTITIAYGTRQIVLSGNVTNSNATGTVTITNQHGVTMTIEGDWENGPGYIKYNGATYANIQRLSGGMMKITYKDDTFEIL